MVAVLLNGNKAVSNTGTVRIALALRLNPEKKIISNLNCAILTQMIHSQRLSDTMTQQMIQSIFIVTDGTTHLTLFQSLPQTTVKLKVLCNLKITRIKSVMSTQMVKAQGQ